MWVWGHIPRIIREPYCANLMHSDLDVIKDMLDRGSGYSSEEGGSYVRHQVIYAEIHTP